VWHTKSSGKGHSFISSHFILLLFLDLKHPLLKGSPTPQSKFSRAKFNQDGAKNIQSYIMRENLTEFSLLNDSNHSIQYTWPSIYIDLSNKPWFIYL